MEIIPSPKSVRKSALTTVAAVILTTILVGSVVGGAGYVYSTQTGAIVAELKSDNSKLGSQVKSAQDESAKLNSQIVNIQDEGKNLKSLNDNLNSRIRASDEDNNRFKFQINDLNGRISDMSEKTAALSRSAVVSFEFVPQPERVKVDVSMGVKVRFLKFTTVDGINFNGAIWEPQNERPKLAFLLVHGLGANYTITFGSIPSVLASKGYAALSINTRAHDGDALKDNLNDNQKNLAAGVSILKNLGYDKLVLLGYSAGALHVIHYEAFARDPAVRAVVIGGAGANLPWLTKSLSEARDTRLYDRLYNTAKELIAQGKPTAMLPEQMPSTLGPLTISAISFMTYASPEGAVSTTLIRQIPVPILMIRNQSDSVVPHFDPQWLVGNATAPGSQVTSMKFVLLPDSKPPSRAGHQVRNFQGAFLNSILTWLDEIKLG